MGRLVRIAIYALVILIVYFWVNAMMKSNLSAPKAPEKPVVAQDTTAIDSTMMTDTSMVNEDMITNDEIVDQGIDYKEVDSKVDQLVEQKKKEPKPTQPIKEVNKVVTKEVAKPTTEKSVPKPNLTKPTPTQTTKGDGGGYLVMAGSYLLKENANKMVKKLKNLGYPNAEVIIFNASEYHSVIAARFSEEAKALDASINLKQKGIDSFVKH